MSAGADYPKPLLRDLVAEGEARFPEEACGLVFEGPKGKRAQAMVNVIDRYHVRDPNHFPRNARTGYLMEPREQLAALEAAERDGERLCAIFHSHVDVGAYFSKEDLAMAVTDEGEALYPGVEYLVLSVRAGHCDVIKGFKLEGGGRSTEREVPLP
jgi:proteasome lid subunit RPN8/RPN11